MDKETVKKENNLLKEIEELKRYKNLKATRYSNAVHFEIVQHYGDCEDYDKILIDTKHNDRLIAVIDKIIIELESELDSL